METRKENLYIIGYGLSGGFGGIQNYLVIECESQEKAEKEAFEMACEYYDGYAGSNGLRDISEIMQEDEIEDEDEALEVFNDEREGWLDYNAKPYSKEYEEKVSGYHYENRFKEITDSE